MKSPKGILLVLAIVVATFLLAAPAALASTQLNSYEKQLVTLINKERAKHGLPQLRVNAKLVDSARGHSAEMGEAKYFNHDSVSGESWSSRIVRYGYSRQGYSYWKAGENLYWGANIYSSPVLCLQAWMKSSQHRAVVLTKVFRDIGVGAVKTDSGYGDVDGTVWFFTLDLGRRTQ
jgi:uncharacterized protein YkwD